MSAENPYPPPTHREDAELDAARRAVPDARRSLLRNAAINVAGEGLWGFGTATVASSTVLVTFLQRHGASEQTAGVLAAIEAGAGLLQIAGPFVFRSHRRRKRQILIWHFVAILPALYGAGLLVAFGGALGDSTLRVAVLVCTALFFGCIGVVAGVWNDWFAHLFDARVRGTISGLMWCGMAGSAALGGAVAAGLLDTFPPERVYAMLYAVAAAVCTASISVFAFVDDPAEAAPEAAPPRGRELLALMRASLRAPAVRALLIARVLGNAAFAIAPFLALHFLSSEGGGLSSPQLVTCGIGLTVGTAVAALAFGRLGDRWGHRRSLLGGFVLAAGALSAALLLHGIVACVVAYCLLGLGSGAWLAAGYLVHETTPHGSRLAQIIACNLVQAGFGLVIPLGWGLLGAHAGLPALMVACLVAALGGLLWAVLAVREPRAAR